MKNDMNQEVAIEDFYETYLPEMKSDVGDLIHYSAHLLQLFYQCGLWFEIPSAETFEEQSVDVFSKGMKLASDLSFLELIIYISAFADTLQEYLDI